MFFKFSDITFAPLKYYDIMDVKTRIVETSLELFLDKGCKSVTMDDVAKANGVSKRTVYELFNDKSHLLEECIGLMMEQIVEYSEKMEKNNNNVVDIIFEIYDSHSDRLSNLRMNFLNELKRYYYPLFKSLIQKLLNYHQSVTYGYIERGQNEGIIKKDINSVLLSKVMIEISNLLEYSGIFSLKEYSRKELFREVIIPFMRGLCTEMGIEMIDKRIAQLKQ